MDTLINHRYVTTSHTAYPIFATFRLADESTRQREFGNLLAIRNNYPKYVVSLDEWTSGSNVNGIQHIHLADFLRME